MYYENSKGILWSQYVTAGGRAVINWSDLTVNIACIILPTMNYTGLLISIFYKCFIVRMLQVSSQFENVEF